MDFLNVLFRGIKKVLSVDFLEIFPEESKRVNFVKIFSEAQKGFQRGF